MATCWKFLLALTTSLLLICSGTAQHTDEDEECIAETDLMLVLDGSKSVTKPNFEVVKRWVKQLAEGMHIGHGHIQIGVVQYSYFYHNRPITRQRYIKTEVRLGQYMNKAQFDAAIDRIRYQGYQTYTAHALNKTLTVDFVGGNNRYPQAKRALILMTDGRATDAEALPPVVKLAKSMGVVIYAVGVGDYDIAELQLITGNHSGRIFKLSNFDDLHVIISDLQHEIRTVCDCDVDGSVSMECDACTQKCDCKENVIGRRCDMCASGYYGLPTLQTCKACECSDFGSANVTHCDAVTGQCECRPGSVAGRQCDRCAEGFFGFPECRRCECNGFSTTCDRATGVCVGCSAGRVGDHCERCEPGHFWDEGNGQCMACACNGNINASDPSACDAESGLCLKCLHHTTGKNCEVCEDYYYGDAANQSCTKCQCDMLGVDKTQCDGDNCRCGPQGMCKCLPNVEGESCDRCARNTFGMAEGNGCKECECGGPGTKTNSTCDQLTGQCSCEKGYTGNNCDDCAKGFDRGDTGDNLCFALLDLVEERTEPTPPDTGPLEESTKQANPSTTTPAPTTTRKTTTLATTTRKTKSRPRVNPGWSPCTSCGGGYSWPSYCHGWMCRRRWPYHEQRPSPRRCYSGNWGCRASMSSHYGYHYTPSHHSQYYYGYWNAPSYYRGYHHHPMNRKRTYRTYPRIRYNLYRSKK